MTMHARAWRSVVVVALLSHGGCATYSDGIGQEERLLAEGKSEAALTALVKQVDEKQDRVLYLLNKAMNLHMAGDYAASNAALEEAKPLIERKAVISASEQAAALSVNDSQRAYAGAQYERIYVHIYAAVNYLALGQLQEARVEALQIDTALGQIDKKEPVPAGFAYYLSGLVYEALGEWDDAMIDYRKAYEAYRAYPDAYHVPLPTSLKEDLVRVAARQGFDDELARYREEFGLACDAARARSSVKGEVIVVLQTGLAPVKRGAGAGGGAAGGRRGAGARPYYQAREIDVSQATLRVTNNAAQTRTEPVVAVVCLVVAVLVLVLLLFSAR